MTSPDRLAGALFKRGTHMAKQERKITDLIRRRKNGLYVLEPYIDGERRNFTSMDYDTVLKKYYAAIEESKTKKQEQDSGPLFEEVCDAYELRVEKMKYGTQRTYMPAIRRVREHFQGKRMREIEPYMISAFLQGISSRAYTTVANHKTVLNAVFQTWIESPVWHGDVNPSKIVTIPRGLRRTKREPPTDEQVQVVKDHYLDADALPAVVYLCTGERRGEACGIQLKDIDFKDKTISITKAVEYRNNKPRISTTKTEAGIRKVPLLSMLEEALAPLRELPESTYILSGSTKMMTWTQYDKKWMNFWKKHGFAHEIKEKQRKVRHGKEFVYEVSRWRADVVAHQFRHEYVCMLCMAEVPEEVAIQLVGHANARMIHEVYMSLKPQMIKGAGEKLNQLLKG